jgi:hypothetical protein
VNESKEQEFYKLDAATRLPKFNWQQVLTANVNILVMNAMAMKAL